MKISTIVLILTITLQTKTQLLGGLSESETTKCAEPLSKFLEKYGYGDKIHFPYKITKCKTQVVAGMNFKMELEIYNQNCDITLYRDLRNQITVNQNNDNSCFEFGDVN